MISHWMQTTAKPTPHQRSSRDGYALMLALGVMLILSLSTALLDRTIQHSLEVSRLAATRVQADYACLGATHQAVQDQLGAAPRMYEYYGTRVQVTVHQPPRKVLEDVLKSQIGSATSTLAPNPANLAMYCAIAASPSADSSAESTWYYVIHSAPDPEIWASWPGIERQQPYQ